MHKNILLENLIRFGVKNVSYENLYKLLKEEKTPREQINSFLDTNPEFKQWFNNKENFSKNKIVKSFQMKTVEPKISEVTVPFFNNFVTIDKGSPNPDAMKAAIDAVLEELKKAGANLENSETVIEILSTATKSPAGLNPDKAAIAAGQKTIDHTYGLTGDIKKTFADKQAKDDQWGNTYLALKRGESARDYIKAKGVKADIKIIPKIVPVTEGRKFKIVAKVSGQEKSISPITVGDVKLKVSIGFKPELSTGAGIGMAAHGSGIEAQNISWKQYPVIDVVWVSTLEWPIESYGTGRVSYNNMRKVTRVPIGYVHEWLKRKQFNADADYNPFIGYNTDYKKFDPRDYLSSIGHLTEKQADLVSYYMPYALQPNMLTLLNNNLLQKLFALCNWVVQKGYSSGTNSTIFYDKEFQKTNKPEGRGGTYSEYQLEGLQKTYYNESKQFEMPTENLEFTIKDIAAAFGGSPEISKDVKYWSKAAFIDLTQTPIKFGDIKTNPKFFDDAIFNVTN